MSSFNYWQVPNEYASSIFNYLVYGHEPGSFFSAVIENNFTMAVMHSHPGNTIVALKALCGWMREHMPPCSWGSENALHYWLDLSTAQRRQVLEDRGLILTPERETFEALKGNTGNEYENY